MSLTELLKADEGGVRDWFAERNLDLLRECPCGYTTYDPDRVNEAVQAAFGDAYAQRIWDWACNLSNRFGWMFEVDRIPEDGLSFCQHCSPSRADSRR